MQLRPGDYVKTRDIESPEQAKAIADAFIHAGAHKGSGYPYETNTFGWQYLGWNAVANMTDRFYGSPSQSLKRRLTPHEVLATVANDDGWIEWHGGSCPVPTGTRVDVEHRDGDVFYDVAAGHSFASVWSHGVLDSNGDIVRYRLHEPKAETDQRIEALERELEALKQARRAEQAEPAPVEKWEPEGGEYWIHGSGRVRNGSSDPDFAAFGTERPNRELAEDARDKMRAHNRALAYVDELEPDWDGSDPYAVSFCGTRYTAEPHTNEIGTVTGPRWVMERLADDLNTGRVEL